MATRDRIRHFVAVGVSAIWLASSQLFAQGESGFVPVKPGDVITEKLPATPLVFAAYAVVWLVLVVYVLTLWRRIAKTEREVGELAARLEGKR